MDCLPSPVLGSVLEYLRYQDIYRLKFTCKRIYHQSLCKDIYCKTLTLDDLPCTTRELTEILRSYPSLQSLSLKRTTVLSLYPLRALTKLRILNISFTQITCLTTLKKLIHLETLDISNTSIRDLSPLRNLLDLKTINISRTFIADLSH